MKVIALDFETEAIQPRPHYPPKPVGVSITWPTGKSEYLAWGHKEGNNYTLTEAKRKLKAIYNEHTVLFHNGKFDLEVGEAFLGLPLEPKNDWHDSMLLAFLYNPREWALKLKYLADKYLDMPASEQAELNQWIQTNIFTSEKGGKGTLLFSKTRPKGYHKIPDSKLGGFICHAPAKLVGKYAKGDTVRTLKLFRLFYKYVKDEGMLEQYEIEKRVVLKAVRMEQQGIPVDEATLEPDTAKAIKVKAKHERAMQKIVGDINFNSGPQIVEAFNKKKLVKQWEYTEKGNEKTGVDSLLRVCTDKKLVHHLDMYSKYSKIVGTYMQPWLNSAKENNGVFYPWFNTIKGDNDKGTYTGRFSSNFQQVPRRPSENYKTLPFLRNYITSDSKKHLLYNRDYSGQEIRIMAHFEDGALLEAFNNNPALDGHEFVRQLIYDTTGEDYGRPKVKGCNFLAVYGGGAPAMVENIGIPLAEAKDVLKAHAAALPDLKGLKDELRLLYRNDGLFKTAGGRWYDFEEGKDYVALNTLIQGSAADHSKRGLLSVSDMIDAQGYDARIMLQVHDEFMISGSKKLKKQFMLDFKEAMEQDALFDLPMLSDGKIGTRWGTMEKVR